ncbi:MAG: D-alanyl-D-alanine carboxypeptidase, partial [Lachnospiraceae bacterium]|nr:D-alanyl-D-alanine carboxypeptidase [Lachnospiraceae bacterium]
MLSYHSISAYAAPTEESDAPGEETEEESGQIETNLIPNWPAGPELNAEAALLMEAESGIVLYAKNSHKHLYPASTSKMMTALLAAENCELDEMVTFS